MAEIKVTKFTSKPDDELHHHNDKKYWNPMMVERILNSYDIDECTLKYYYQITYRRWGLHIIPSIQEFWFTYFTEEDKTSIGDPSRTVDLLGDDWEVEWEHLNTGNTSGLSIEIDLDQVDINEEDKTATIYYMIR